MVCFRDWEAEEPRENYVDYLANRPRVERVGEHGLFTDVGTPVVISKVQEDVKHHKGPVSQVQVFLTAITLCASLLLCCALSLQVYF